MEQNNIISDKDISSIATVDKMEKLERDNTEKLVSEPDSFDSDKVEIIDNPSSQNETKSVNSDIKESAGYINSEEIKTLEDKERNVIEPFEDIYSPYLDNADHESAGLEGFHVMESLKHVSFSNYYKSSIKTMQDHLSEIIKLYKEVFQPKSIIDSKTVEDLQKDILNAGSMNMKDLIKNMQSDNLRKLLEAEEEKKTRLERFPFLMDLCFSYYILLFDTKAPFIKFPTNFRKAVSYIKLLKIGPNLDLTETFEHLYSNETFTKLCFSPAPLYIIEDTSIDNELVKLMSFKEHIKMLINLLIKMTNIRAKKRIVEFTEPIASNKDLEEYDQLAQISETKEDKQNEN